MSSSEDIRNTIELLENIQAKPQLDEGFSMNPFDMKVGGVTIGSIIKGATDSMSPEEKRNWVVQFLEGFFGAGELAELGKHLFNKHDTTNESIYEARYNDNQGRPVIKGVYMGDRRHPQGPLNALLSFMAHDLPGLGRLLVNVGGWIVFALIAAVIGAVLKDFGPVQDIMQQIMYSGARPMDESDNENAVDPAEVVQKAQTLTPRMAARYFQQLPANQKQVVQQVASRIQHEAEQRGVEISPKAAEMLQAVGVNSSSAG
jgi:hypothetical protein